MPGTVLIIDDEEATAIALRDGLRRFDLTTEASFEPEEALSRMESKTPDVVLVDLCLAGVSGIDVCRRVAAHSPRTTVIVMSGRSSPSSERAAAQAGAHGFITKPFAVETIALRIRHALRERSAANEPPVTPAVALDPGAPTAASALVATGAFAELLGTSPALDHIRRRLTRMAASEAGVLLVGETGTGKEVVARGLHRESRRHAGPFVAINCAALPEALLESELFGHVRGAFTDARADRAGLFVRARGGTLFLDEIGDLPAALQPKLLRVLEDRRVRPVGGDDEVAVDVRVIAATHHDLEAQARLGRFRMDLFYRLNVLRAVLPPLRERGDDVLQLARVFMSRAASSEGRPVPELGDDAAHALLAHGWPGNVRELRNCMEYAVAMATGDELGCDDLPDEITRAQRGAGDPTWPSLAEVERRYVDRVLDHTGGNRSVSARILGINRRTLMRKLAAGVVPTRRRA